MSPRRNPNRTIRRRYNFQEKPTFVKFISDNLTKTLYDGIVHFKRSSIPVTRSAMGKWKLECLKSWKTR